MSAHSRAVAATLTALALALAYNSSRRALAAPARDDPSPPSSLMETGLYELGRPGVVQPDNRPFSPQYPLWTDGAAKKRWFYLPPGLSIHVAESGDWEFPEGARLWKEFSFGGRKVETRMLWKVSAERWVAASYVWNAEQTDATLAPEGGVPGIVEVAPGRRHSVPSRADCGACHGPNHTPLGFNALQLSTDRDPDAIHGEPLAPEMLTLATLVDERLLAPAPTDLVSHPPRIRSASPRTRTVLGYLAANCGSCHNGRGEIAANLPSLAYGNVMADGDAVARSFIERATRWQLPGTSEGTTLAIDPAAPERSALLARMLSRRPASQMPPLGTVLRDQQALDALTQWVALDLKRTAGHPEGERPTR